MNLNHMQKHWKATVILAIGLALYFYFTRQKVIGTVDVSGEGMTVN